MARATIGGLEIEYRIYGEGTPVLFVHGGFGGPNSSLLPSPNAITQDIPNGFQLVTFDRRCAGESDYTLEWFDLADIASDAYGLMQYLGFEQSIVVGSSMGGIAIHSPIFSLRHSSWFDEHRCRPYVTHELGSATRSPGQPAQKRRGRKHFRPIPRTATQSNANSHAARHFV